MLCSILIMGTKSRLLGTLFCVFVTSASARAGVIVSTYNSTPPGYIGDAYQLSNVPSFSQDIPWAMQFLVPTGPSFEFTGFTAAFSVTAPVIVDFTLLSDAAGTPGTAIETISLALSSSTPGIVTGISALDPTLTGGTSYWLGASLESAANAAWYTPAHLGTKSTGLVADRNLPSFPNWSAGPGVEAAFEIDGNQIGASTPEPATVAITLAGLGWMILGRRRRVSKASKP